MNGIDISLVDWSRYQFALTAIYHWLFVPLTLGLSFIVAFMHTMYYKTQSKEWEKMTRFWMKLFGINFAIGVATGIILEFEFGTNWSNYSWFVGDIFGAPLAIEGIMAFFLESTFIAVMFFGWDKVSKKFHMVSSWLVAFGSNLSALWILVANAWMQNPVGTEFNPVTARNEMTNFWEVLLSPTAVYKFLHTVTSSYVLAACFVVGVSAWYILKGRHLVFARKSMMIASIFGAISLIFTVVSGDSSGYDVAQKQPMKLAAMENIYKGEEGAGFPVLALVRRGKKPRDGQDEYIFSIKVPYIVSYLAKRDFNAFVPGVEDIVYGNEKYGIPSVQERMDNGKIAVSSLQAFNKYRKEGNEEKANEYLAQFKANYKDFGYAYLEKPEDVVPNVPLVFFSFRVMVVTGFLLFLAFFYAIFISIKNRFNKKWILKFLVLSIPLAYISSISGWIVAEVGRQPWTIQDILPVGISTSHLSTNTVIFTFWLFATLFTILLFAELKIMFAQIKKGPKE
jgi:cytochrome d ubiquinol oxidase subunit I